MKRSIPNYETGTANAIADDNITLTIESGVPIPAKFQPSHRWAGKIRMMKIGDSILFPMMSRHIIANAASRILGPGSYTCRKVEGGIRMWRTK